MQVDKDFVDLLPRHRLLYESSLPASLGCTTGSGKIFAAGKIFCYDHRTLMRRTLGNVGPLMAYRNLPSKNR